MVFYVFLEKCSKNSEKCLIFFVDSLFLCNFASKFKKRLLHRITNITKVFSMASVFDA